MTMRSHPHRRRAAVLVLGPWLDAQALEQALVLQQQTLRDTQTTSLIRYIDALAAQHQWDAPHCKRLYLELFKAVQLADDQLPPDPWHGAAAPGSQTARAPARPQPTDPAPAPAPAPAMQAAPASVQAVVSAPAAPPPPPEPVIVFAQLVRHVVAQVQRLHPEALGEVARDVQRLLPRLTLPAALLGEAQAAWADPQRHDWRIAAASADLRQLMAPLEDALVDAFGAVGARQVLQGAAQAAERLPEARLCPPRELLRRL
jgi:hypothetical protein